jgi:polyhydroxyalkanoate synthesis regulator phasin
MIDQMFRKTIQTAVEIIAGSSEKLQSKIDEMISKGKISAEEGRKIVEEVFSTVGQHKEDYEQKFRNMVDAVIQKLNLPQSESYDKLERRVKSLEVKLGLLAKELDNRNKIYAKEAEEEKKEKKSTRKSKK